MLRFGFWVLQVIVYMLSIRVHIVVDWGLYLGLEGLSVGVLRGARV